MVFGRVGAAALTQSDEDENRLLVEVPEPATGPQVHIDDPPQCLGHADAYAGGLLLQRPVLCGSEVDLRSEHSANVIIMSR